ncbi:MAG: cytidine deaminase [Firmicutes bacterium]|nr:cytidine deaminase [Bacillota bacterium]
MEREDELVEAARQARERAYVPYSKFRVGAALLGASGRVYLGCNVENASYGATICAERTAFVKAISEGERDFKALAVVGTGADPVSPCGVCRQFMSEFGLDMPVIMAGDSGDRVIRTVAELLPAAFSREDME